MNKRQKEIIASALVKVLAIVYIVIFIIGFAKIIANGSLTGSIPEIIFLIAVPVLVFLFTRSLKSIRFPTRIAGMEVRAEGTKNALIGRIQAYILDSLPLAIVTALFIGVSDMWQAHREGRMTRLGSWLDAIGSMLVEWIVFFIAFFAIDYFMFEYKARKYREQQQRREKRKQAYEATMGYGEDNEDN